MYKNIFLRLAKLFLYFLSIIITLSLLYCPSFCWADEAMVLPKGRWMTNLSVDIYPYWAEEFDNQGHPQSLAKDYCRNLNSQVFKDLSPFDKDPNIQIPLGLPSDFKASLGVSIVKFEKRAVVNKISIQYGLTERISVGFLIPYWYFKTKVKSSLNSEEANMAKNPAIEPGYQWSDYLPDPENAPLIPIDYNPPGLPKAVADIIKHDLEQLKLTKEDLIDILGNGLPYMPGYGFKRFKTWSEEDIGDLEAGAKYQYLKNDRWRLALQGIIRLPTGRKDDPDNLLDYGFGGGNYDLLMVLNNDFIGIKDFTLSGTVRYTLQLPDKETLRVPEAVDLPLTRRKERVSRDLGDIFELELSIGYRLTSGYSIMAAYGGFFKEKDQMKISGKRFKPLEDETSQTGHTFLIGISYNNLERYQKKLASFPYSISLSHWQRFAGKNLNKAQYLTVKISLFF